MVQGTHGCGIALAPISLLLRKLYGRQTITRSQDHDRKVAQ